MSSIQYVSDLPEEMLICIGEFATINSRVQLSRTSHYFRRLAKFSIDRNNETVILEPSIPYMTSPNHTANGFYERWVLYHSYTDTDGDLRRIIYKRDKFTDVSEYKSPIYFGKYATSYGVNNYPINIVCCEQAISYFRRGGMVPINIRYIDYITDDVVNIMDLDDIFIDLNKHMFMFDSDNTTYICNTTEVVIKDDEFSYRDRHGNMHTIYGSFDIYNINEYRYTTSGPCVLLDINSGESIICDWKSRYTTIFKCLHFEKLF